MHTRDQPHLTLPFPNLPPLRCSTTSKPLASYLLRSHCYWRSCKYIYFLSRLMKRPKRSQHHCMEPTCSAVDTATRAPGITRISRFCEVAIWLPSANVSWLLYAIMKKITALFQCLYYVAWVPKRCGAFGTFTFGARCGGIILGRLERTWGECTWYKAVAGGAHCASFHFVLSLYRCCRLDVV